MILKLNQKKELFTKSEGETSRKILFFLVLPTAAVSA